MAININELQVRTTYKSSLCNYNEAFKPMAINTLIDSQYIVLYQRNSTVYLVELDKNTYLQTHPSARIENQELFQKVFTVR